MPVTADILKEQLQAPDDVWIITPEFTVLLPSGHKLGKVSSTELPHCFVLTCLIIACYKVVLYFYGVFTHRCHNVLSV
jgi:hypothetical protein